MRSYDNSVFINCPFDSTYRPLFEAVAFADYDCGFYPWSALEVEDSREVRIEKIIRLISECRLAVHDISRTQMGPGSRLRGSTCRWNSGSSSAQKRSARRSTGGKPRSCSMYSNPAAEVLAARLGEVMEQVRRSRKS